MLRWPRCQGSGPAPLPVIPRNLDCVHQMPSFRNKTRAALSRLVSVLTWLFSQKPPSVSHSEASPGMSSYPHSEAQLVFETISSPLKIPSDHPTQGRASHRSAGFPFLSRIGCSSSLQLSTCSQVGTRPLKLDVIFHVNRCKTKLLFLSLSFYQPLMLFAHPIPSVLRCCSLLREGILYVE